MKDLQIVMQKAPNVLKITFILMTIYLLNSCKSQKEIVDKKNGNYKIERYKSKDYFIGISVNAFDKISEDLLLRPTIVINNVYLKGNTFKVGLGNHNIKILYLGKKDITIKNLKITKNDSIVIKAYLEGEDIID